MSCVVLVLAVASVFDMRMPIAEDAAARLLLEQLEQRPLVDRVMKTNDCDTCDA